MAHTLSPFPSLAFLPASIVPQVSLVSPCPSVPAKIDQPHQHKLIKRQVQPMRNLISMHHQPGHTPELRRPLPKGLGGPAGDRHRRRQRLARHGERQRRRAFRHVHRLPEPGLDAGDGHGAANAGGGVVHRHHRRRGRRARVRRRAQEVRLAVVVWQEMMMKMVLRREYAVVRLAADRRRVHVDLQANATAAAMAVVVVGARQRMEIVDLVVLDLVGVAAAVVDAGAFVAASDAHEVLKLGAFAFCAPPI
jgi:hypothetical protein